MPCPRRRSIVLIPTTNFVHCELYRLLRVRIVALKPPAHAETTQKNTIAMMITQLTLTCLSYFFKLVKTLEI
uniref:Uncharacterized protein n=1 Tax=Trichogramma kaykai TaxID=54128 RepID=A0ABD2WTY1_9HYME